MAAGLTTTAWAGVALIALATGAGALLGRRTSRHPAASMAAAASVLLAVVLGDLVPDIWRDTSEAGLAWWVPPAACVGGFAVADAPARWGCACRTRPAAGAAAAVAIGLHRGLEGSALAIAASIPVVAALVVHAAGEGFALASLLRAGRRTTAGWLLVACVSPAVGAAALGAVSLPAAATPVLTALVAGVLLRSAMAAYQHARITGLPRAPARRRRAAGVPQAIRGG